MARRDRVDDLTEEEARQAFVKHHPVGDEVEQVLDGLGSLHDNDERVLHFVPVEHADHSAHVGHFLEQTYFERDGSTVVGFPCHHLVTFDVFDCNLKGGQVN